MNTTSIAEIKGLQTNLDILLLTWKIGYVMTNSIMSWSEVTDVIEFTDYNVDIADCLSALHDAMTNFEMYD